MMNWSDSFSKQREFWIAISASEISKHLIVGTVFLDDVKNVLDRKSESCARTEDWRAGIYLLCPSRSMAADVALINDRQRAAQKSQHVITSATLGVRLRTIWTGTTPPNSLGAQHEQ